MGRFSFNTAGESHGYGLVAIIDGMVADMEISVAYINKDLKRRQGGYGRGGRMKIESDIVNILSGVRHGYSIGTPIGLLIKNKDWVNWEDQMNVSKPLSKDKPITSPRPGHADLAGYIKYGVRDIRLILERASARETAIRVAVGAIARKFLLNFGINIYSHTIAIGGITATHTRSIDWDRVENSVLRCNDTKTELKMLSKIDKAFGEGDTLGGIFEVKAIGVPVGLGSHVRWDAKLDAQIAQAFMSINSVKGVEIGDGFLFAEMFGSNAHDIIELNQPDCLPMWKRASNRAGGIEGGISNGEPIVVRAVVKPIATLKKALPSIDLSTGKIVQSHYERSDVCIVPVAGVIGEAMLAIVLADAILNKFGGDNLKETLQNFRNFVSTYS